MKAAIVRPPGEAEDGDMLIDCNECAAQHTRACRDCVVTHLLSDTAGVVHLDGDQSDALEALADCGLIPQLRLVHRAASG